MTARLSLTVVIVFAFLVTPALADSRAGSWFVDEVKYHVSAHGRVSCQDCHPDVIRRSVHPSPADVVKDLKTFFNAETCFNCHDRESLKRNLEEGVHGGKPIEKARSYSNCIDCHEPHYQPRLGKKGISVFERVSHDRDLCASCHDKRLALPAPEGDDVKCVQCHKAVGPRDNERVPKTARFCLECHGRQVPFSEATVGLSLIDTVTHVSRGHSQLDCLTCHAHAAAFGHNRQPPVACRQCHPPHHEATIRDGHASVSCQACHLREIKPTRDTETSKVIWGKPTRATGLSRLDVVRPAAGTDSCGRCHYAGNKVGAAAVVLPAKSIICMPCHAATFSANDGVSVLALLGFAVGMCLAASVWLSGTARPWSGLAAGSNSSFKRDYSRRVGPVLAALFLDGLLQRRLFVRSRTRWFVHGLIVWPFVLRFGWGLTALAGSLACPTQGWVESMLDKNNPLTAFVFDLTGLMVICGIILAALRKRFAGGEAGSNDLPASDWWAMGLLGGIVVVGFVLEGARIALTGAIGPARFAFVGWALSFLWRGTDGLSEIYGYVWYLHAFLTAAFLAYLPFSGMFHLVVAPVVAVLNAAVPLHRRRDHSRREPHGGAAHDKPNSGA